MIVFSSCFAGGAVLGDTSHAEDVSSAFTSTECKILAEPGKESIEAAWSLTDHWDFPLSVEKLSTYCGCLAPMEDQTTIAPGESGNIIASFSPGHHRGLLRKSLHVSFVGHEGTVELVASATIPSPVELSTQELIWQKDQKTKTRTVDVTSGTGEDFLVTGILGLPEHFYSIEIGDSY